MTQLSGFVSLGSTPSDSFSDVSVNAVDENFDMDAGCEYVPESLASFLTEAKTTLEKTQASFRELLNQNSSEAVRNADSTDFQYDDIKENIVVIVEDDEDLKIKRELLGNFASPQSMFRPYPLKAKQNGYPEQPNDEATSETSSSTSDESDYLSMKKDILDSFQEEHGYFLSNSDTDLDQQDQVKETENDRASFDIICNDRIMTVPTKDEKMHQCETLSTTSDESDYLAMRQEILDSFQEEKTEEYHFSDTVELQEQDERSKSDCAKVDVVCKENVQVEMAEGEKRLGNALEKAAAHMVGDAQKLECPNDQLCRVSKSNMKRAKAVPESSYAYGDAKVQPGQLIIGTDPGATCSTKEENRVTSPCLKEGRKLPGTLVESQSTTLNVQKLHARKQGDSINKDTISTEEERTAFSMCVGEGKQAARDVESKEDTSNVQERHAKLVIDASSPSSTHEYLQHWNGSRPANAAKNNEHTRAGLARDVAKPKRSVTSTISVEKEQNDRSSMSRTERTSLRALKRQAQSVMDANNAAIGSITVEQKNNSLSQKNGSATLEAIMHKAQSVIVANNAAIDSAMEDIKFQCQADIHEGQEYKAQSLINANIKAIGGKEDEKARRKKEAETPATSTLVPVITNDLNKKDEKQNDISNKSKITESSKMKSMRAREDLLNKINEKHKRDNKRVTNRTIETPTMQSVSHRRIFIESAKANSRKQVADCLTTKRASCRSRANDKDQTRDSFCVASPSQLKKIDEARARARKRVHEFKMRQRKQENSPDNQAGRSILVSSSRSPVTNDKKDSQQLKECTKQIQKRQIHSPKTAQNHNKNVSASNDQNKLMNAASERFTQTTSVRTRRIERRGQRTANDDTKASGQLVTSIKQSQMSVLDRAKEIVRRSKRRKQTTPRPFNPTTNSDANHSGRQRESSNENFSARRFHARAVPQSTYACTHPPKPYKKTLKTNSAVISNRSEPSKNHKNPKSRCRNEGIIRPPLAQRLPSSTSRATAPERQVSVLYAH